MKSSMKRASTGKQTYILGQTWTLRRITSSNVHRSSIDQASREVTLVEWVSIHHRPRLHASSSQTHPVASFEWAWALIQMRASSLVFFMKSNVVLSTSSSLGWREFTIKFALQSNESLVYGTINMFDVEHIGRLDMARNLQLLCIRIYLFHNIQWFNLSYSKLIIPFHNKPICSLVQILQNTAFCQHLPCTWP